MSKLHVFLSTPGVELRLAILLVSNGQRVVLPASYLSDCQVLISEKDYFTRHILDVFFLSFLVNATFAVKSASPSENASIICQCHSVEERASYLHDFVWQELCNLREAWLFDQKVVLTFFEAQLLMLV